MESKKQNKTRQAPGYTGESGGSQGQEVGGMGKRVKQCKLSAMREISHGDETFSTVANDSDSVLHIYK